MPLSVQIPTPRPSRESLIKRLRIPKARQNELLDIMREPETDTPAPSSSPTFAGHADLTRAYLATDTVPAEGAHP
jgi:hypothetical protein